MIIKLDYFAIILSALSLSSGLPLDNVQHQRADVAHRAKSYQIVNVDGGSTAPSEPTTVVAKITATETIKVTDVPLAATDTTTTTVVEHTPIPPLAPTLSSLNSRVTSTLSSTNSASSPCLSSTPGSTLLPSWSPSQQPPNIGGTSILTVVITAPVASSTEYYDNGMWHTNYPVKTRW
ncbi:hypothetical protein CC78DRAFT_533789 [Lojkania enalia]|uniref:Uncharacterized protein n=1 Tax=Lojkania enalia TaxID=147567 RepID=A0A9P4K8N5_9PLEO|nr:hypothetical protein CC78DRAFT_533789 [Didymosphaeria enalia]